MGRPVALPPPTWNLIDSRDRANARVFGDERFTICYERRLDLFSAIDLERRVAIAWTHDAAALPSDAPPVSTPVSVSGWPSTPAGALGYLTQRSGA